jgi:hypothetical protein
VYFRRKVLWGKSSMEVAKLPKPKVVNSGVTIDLGRTDVTRSQTSGKTKEEGGAIDEESPEAE